MSTPDAAPDTAPDALPVATPNERAPGDVEQLTGALMAARAEIQKLRESYQSDVSAAAARIRGELESEIEAVKLHRQREQLEAAAFRGLDPSKLNAARIILEGLIKGGELDPSIPGAGEIARDRLGRIAGYLYANAPARSSHPFAGRSWSDLSMGERAAVIRNPDLRKHLVHKEPK